MLFNSAPFLFWFLPIVLAGYYAVSAARRTLILLIASYVFYAWWNPFFCGLMFFSTCVDFIAGRGIARSTSQETKRNFLILSIATNLSLLGFFKYYGMLSETLATLAGSPIFPLWQILLPIGISFYTFQSMSYSLDIYRGIAKPAESFVDFACFVSLFPQLIAGPIVRYNELALQLRERSHTFLKGAQGAYRFIIGLAKKVIIADAFAVIADQAFGAEVLTAWDAWIGLFAYSFQIYFDFAGYSDMAIGLGMLFGFRFPENFRMPYLSTSIREFWQRWHITLSTFLRDYLYIPLGGNRFGRLLTARNLLITMFLGGLWHGAAWTFVAWGLLHGAYLGAERLLGKRNPVLLLPSLFQQLFTFLLVSLAWILFRSESFPAAITFFTTLFAGDFAGAPSLPSITLVLVGFICMYGERFLPNLPRRFTAPLSLALSVLFILCVIIIFGNAASPFLYFQF